MKVVSVKTYFVRQPERQRAEELRRQLWWPCPSSSLRRAPLGALTSQCSLSLLFAQPPPPRAVEACSAALWAVVQFPAGGDRGLCQCASVPVCHPRTQTFPHPLAPSPPPQYLSPAFQSMLTGAQISYQSFCGKDIRRISDQDSRGLLKTNTLEQS